MEYGTVLGRKLFNQSIKFIAHPDQFGTGFISGMHTFRCLGGNGVDIINCPVDLLMVADCCSAAVAMD